VTPRAIAYLLAALCGCAALLSLPALGEAATGGAGLSGSGGRTATVSGTTQPGNVTVTASAGGMSIATRSSAFLANSLRFTGSVPSHDAGKTIEIELYGQKTNWTWRPTVQATVNGDGSFSAVWQTNHIGRFAARAVLGSAQNGASTASSSWPTVTLTVYRPSIASWYGDLGSRTACGEVLHRNTLGVANKTLPCGTQVALYYRGQTIVVPVIDRGPYVRGRDWDLTQATAQLLKMDGVAQIGAVSLPRRG
jgi:rare lipoprotein A (peptidoglycan hydrolase)